MVDNGKYFEVIENGPNGFRIGKFNFGEGRVLKTPEFFPVMNFITGSPPIYRNGGIWRFIKIEAIKKDHISSFMTQIIHFTDFQVSKNTLDKWWPNGSNETISERITRETEKPDYKPIMFADSGGFKLLYNSSFDVESLGIEENQRGILDFQMKFGPDMVASLDYPLPPGLSRTEAKERTEKSINNCVELVKLLTTEYQDSKTMPYLAVHGTSKSEAKAYTKKLLNQIDKKEFKNIQFGLAIGSLVPIKNNYSLIADIVHGVQEAIANHKAYSIDDIPLHVFGISGNLIPFLSYEGVDTFDSNSYAQAAINLKYMQSSKSGWSYHDFKKLNELTCSCKYCNMLEDGGLKEAKEILKSEPFKMYKFQGKDVRKSHIYAYLAMHNLNVMNQQIDRVNNAYNEGNLEQYLVRYGKHNKKTEDFLRILSKKSPSLKAEMKINKIDTTRQVKLSIPSHPAFSFNYGPDDFDIMNIPNYSPPQGKIALFLPCSKEKPYSKSRTHEIIMKKIKESGIDHSKIHKITISGNYGPVPEEFENEEEILHYNYLLNSNSKKRITLLVNRTVKYLEKHGSQYEYIVGYATGLAYREVLEKAFKQAEKGTILPYVPRRKDGREILRTEHINEFIAVLEELISKKK